MPLLLLLMPLLFLLLLYVFVWLLVQLLGNLNELHGRGSMHSLIVHSHLLRCCCWCCCCCCCWHNCCTRSWYANYRAHYDRWNGGSTCLLIMHCRWLCCQWQKRRRRIVKDCGVSRNLDCNGNLWGTIANSLSINTKIKKKSHKRHKSIETTLSSPHHAW